MTQREWLEVQASLSKIGWKSFTAYVKQHVDALNSSAVQAIPGDLYAQTLRERQLGQIELLQNLLADFSQHVQNQIEEAKQLETNHEISTSTGASAPSDGV